MNHPETILTPLLMLTDYYLTLVGARLYKRKYGEYVRYEHYELNPAWQKSVAEGKWFNPRHLLLVALLGGLVVALGEWEALHDDSNFGFLTGFLLTAYLIIVGRHLANILIFSYVIKNPEQLSGEVRFSHQFTLRVAQYLMLAALLPIAAICVATRSPFATGALISCIWLAIIKARWLRMHRKKQTANESPAQKP